jgi:2-deoxy-D-gluconate 3-dehydrogenase
MVRFRPWSPFQLTAAVRSSPMNDEIIARTPAKRWGKSDEIIGATVFLASRGSDFITGATLPVDGGYSVY